MDNFKHEIAGLCAFNVKDDEVLRAFSALGGRSATRSIEAYSRICGALLAANKSLGEYLKDMLLYSDSPLITLTAEDPTWLRRKAVECDLCIIGNIAGYSSQKLKEALSEKYGDIFGTLPDYEQGEFDCTANELIEFAEKHGSGIFAKYKAFSYRDGLIPIESADPIRLSDLKNYETQRSRVVENTLCFLNGKPAQNVLLYGDRGTGKSSTVKAILNEFEGIRMVELSKNDVGELPELFRLLKRVPLKFILTIEEL
ncbi:MAG: ATP-binding protein, partial [Oscillospiraceae bacterium]|nr:ATP-binding protein [Oscillospiraceae bacterium]